jgi:hypothetical protein
VYTPERERVQDRGPLCTVKSVLRGRVEVVRVVQAAG